MSLLTSIAREEMVVERFLSDVYLHMQAPLGFFNLPYIRVITPSPKMKQAFREWSINGLIH